jgi:hypothetical protein
MVLFGILKRSNGDWLIVAKKEFLLLAKYLLQYRYCGSVDPCLLMEGSGALKITTAPDPTGPKTYGSYGSGSTRRMIEMFGFQRIMY